MSRVLFSHSAGHVRFRPSEWLLLRKAAVRFNGRDRRGLTLSGHPQLAVELRILGLLRFHQCAGRLALTISGATEVRDVET
jgi:hypothetical protein